MASIQNDGTLRNIHRFEPLPNSGGFQGFMDTIRLGVSLSPTGHFANDNSIQNTLSAFLSTYLSSYFTSFISTGLMPSQVTYLNSLNAAPIPPGQIQPGRTTTPLVVKPISPNLTWTLPNVSSYGINTTNGPMVNGAFVVPVINLGTEAATFQPGFGGSFPKDAPGPKIIPPSSSTNSIGYIFIKFTGTDSYTVQ